MAEPLGKNPIETVKRQYKETKAEHATITNAWIGDKGTSIRFKHDKFWHFGCKD